MPYIVERAFIRVYLFYRKFGEIDVFFQASFALSFLFVFVINFIVSFTYFITGFPILLFDIWPIGMILLAVLILCIMYFYNHKSYLDQRINIFNSPIMAIDRFIIIALLIFFILVMFAPFLYKWRNLGMY